MKRKCFATIQTEFINEASKQAMNDSRADTQKHIDRVRCLLDLIIQAIISQCLLNLINQVIALRGVNHDKSKLEPFEKKFFDKISHKLKNCTYGSLEYKAFLSQLKPALKHHYSNNSHHPEHYKDGISGMTLIDLIEMFVDWKAATERHADGDFGRSIEINTERFKMDPQLVQIFKNTKKLLNF